MPSLQRRLRPQKGWSDAITPVRTYSGGVAQRLDDQMGGPMSGGMCEIYVDIYMSALSVGCSSKKNVHVIWINTPGHVCSVALVCDYDTRGVFLGLF